MTFLISSNLRYISLKHGDLRPLSHSDDESWNGSETFWYKLSHSFCVTSTCLNIYTKTIIYENELVDIKYTFDVFKNGLILKDMLK